MENIFEKLADITRPQQDAEFIRLKNTETAINKAIKKVEVKLQWYNAENAKICGKWSEVEEEYFKRWNDWHDLHDRLIDALKDNYSEYQHYHFNKVGWVAI